MLNIFQTLLNDFPQIRQITLQTKLLLILMELINIAIKKEQEETISIYFIQWIEAALGILDSLTQPIFYSNINSEEKQEPIESNVDFFLTKQQQQIIMENCVKLLQCDFIEKIFPKVLLIFYRLTRNFEISKLIMNLHTIELLLTIQLEKNKYGSLLSNILRHIMEDPETLQSVMEREITSLIDSFTKRNERPVTPKILLSTLAPLLCRNPTLFIQTVVNTCLFKVGTTNIILKEKKNILKNKFSKNIPENIKFVITSLMNLFKPSDDKNKINYIPPNNQLKNIDIVHPNHINSVALQLLIDFVTIYPECRKLLLRYQPFKNSKEKKEYNFVQFILNDILGCNFCKDEDKKNAIKILEKLCLKIREKKKIIQEIDNILLEILSKWKSNQFQENFIIKFIQYISDFLYQLLKLSFSQNEISKAILESNISNSLIEFLGLSNFYNSKISSLIFSILKELQLISKFSIESSEHKIQKESTIQTHNDDISRSNQDLLNESSFSNESILDEPFIEFSLSVTSEEDIRREDTLTENTDEHIEETEDYDEEMDENYDEREDITDMEEPENITFSGVLRVRDDIDHDNFRIHFNNFRNLISLPNEINLNSNSNNAIFSFFADSSNQRRNNNLTTESLENILNTEISIMKVNFNFLINLSILLFF